MVAHDRETYRQTMGHEHLGFQEDEMRQMGRDAGFDRITWRRLRPVATGKDPEKYIAKLDAAAIAEQKSTYPLTTCVSTGGGFKESSPWFIVGDRAVRTCCGGCKGKVMKNPRAAVAKLDAATAKAKTDKTSG